jgi:putative DNA primase/helicase
MIEDIDIITKIKEFNKIDKIKININTVQLTDINFMNNNFFLKNPIMYDDYKIWWAWNSSQMRWNKVDETDITISFNNIFNILDVKNTYLSSVKTMILNSLKNTSRIFKNNFVEKIKPYWVVFRDVIIDVKENRTFPNSFKYFSTNPIPYFFNNSDDTDTPVIDKLFEDWVGNSKDKKDWVKTLKQMFSYCMLPSYPIETTFVLHGSGNNGKSTCLNLLSNFIGYNNIVSSDLLALINPNNRFASSKLYKKLVCVMGEVDDTVVKNTGLLKKLVSGKDSINCEFKGKDPLDFINYAKIIMATNNLPMTSDLSDAYFRRFVIIDFDKRFKSNGLINLSIPEQEYENMARQLIPILKELVSKNEFENEGSIEDKKKRYIQKSNPIQGFMDEYCDLDPNGLIPVFEFFDNLEPYLSARNYKKLSKKAVSQYMKNMLGLELQMHRIGENNNPWRCYEGIAWKENAKVIISKYNSNTGTFNNIESLSMDSYSDKVYSKKELYKLFPNFDTKYITKKISELRKIGDLWEFKSGLYKFRCGIND